MNKRKIKKMNVDWKVQIIIGVIVGAIFTVILPFHLTFLHFSSNVLAFINVIIWGIIFTCITKVITFIYSLESRIITSLNEFERRIAISFYKGFYSLLTGSEIKNNFENFDKGLLKAIDFKLPLKSTIFEFIVNSLASIGKNGFAMLDADVSEYVKFIKNSMHVRNVRICVNCVVRPFWFVTDQINNISLTPFISGDEFGKGEHLPYLISNQNKNIQCQRVLIIDEIIITEMLITAFIDYYLFIVNRKKITFQFFNKIQREMSKDINNIFEIDWFEKSMNKDCNYWYTFIEKIDKENREELKDSVTFSSNGKVLLSIQFQFLNLEKGILRINWSEYQNTYIPFIENVKTSLNIDNSEYSFYRDFNSLLKNSNLDLPPTKEYIISYISFLNNLIVNQFNNKNINSIRVSDGEHEKYKFFLDHGSENFRNFLQSILKHLIKKIKKDTISKIYKDLITHFKKNGVPDIAYNITYDEKHPEYPVRLVSWKKNWEGIISNAKNT